jgi:hypothetical protein
MRGVKDEALTHGCGGAPEKLRGRGPAARRAGKNHGDQVARQATGSVNEPEPDNIDEAGQRKSGSGIQTGT